LLKDHRTALETVTQQLLKTETIDGTVVKQALAEKASEPILMN
jgi:ATP-dependent Zn protease